MIKRLKQSNSILSFTQFSFSDNIISKNDVPSIMYQVIKKTKYNKKYIHTGIKKNLKLIREPYIPLYILLLQGDGFSNIWNCYLIQLWSVTTPLPPRPDKHFAAVYSQYDIRLVYVNKFLSGQNYQFITTKYYITCYDI